MKVLKFDNFLYEDGEGGGGVAFATAGTAMGNVSAPGVSTNGMTNTYSGNGHPTNSAPTGSGDRVAHAGTSTKNPAVSTNKKPKKRKFQLEPKNVRMSGTNASKENMYVTSFDDWSGSNVK